jgi:DNA-binding GntR family transcriptional regulator
MPPQTASGPKYRRIADELLAQIKDGEYPPGSRLPTKSELMERYHVAVNTVERAIEELRKAGVVETAQGAGMFVREASSDSGSPSPAATERLERLESEVADLREGLSLVQAQMMNLYQSRGLQYPHEDETAEPGRRAR